MDVNPSTTVEAIKHKLEVDFRIPFPVDKQTLFFNGKELNNTDQISGYSVQDGDMMLLVLEQQETHQIFVKTMPGKS